MTEKHIGKIRSIRFGFGGYQDAQFGISIDFSLDGGSSGISTFMGHWGTARNSSCRWSEEDRVAELGRVSMLAKSWMQDAKVSSLDKLVNIPVEVITEDMNFSSWRVLKEVL